jgi:hypothetical protein
MSNTRARERRIERHREPSGAHEQRADDHGVAFADPPVAMMPPNTGVVDEARVQTKNLRRGRPEPKQPFERGAE